ncbi:PstS family phosphate ABC transporter substrate-binding protein [Petrocella sp. FN5]|uniref:PstS family phosphate ABC transporter substrate-binding protein n=1 Tax=Petrocella sp. FN5 TaxID=3032002 RepID=UPI0023D9D225|nr:PstS family phosphate ABC transporter substrate-binding protein [Petrocella sp. FN5]MDF1616201.1 PstS family phosphate ABC transporter substrate-binding protein [Petrocella sp. FN5]
MKKLLALLLVGVLTMSLVGCGSTEEPAAETTEVETEVAETETEVAEEVELEGAVIVDGSGTVYPLMANIAEEYMVNEQENVSVQVGRAGSSAGFKKFIPGELNFADASRAIKDEEIAQLKENGYEMGTDIYEFVLAYDGLTMVINKDNTWATEMTKEEIINMYLASSNVTTWADIRSEWPAEEIKFYGPNENHGTYEFFYEVILGKEDMVASANLQQDYSTLVDLVANDVNAIAFFGFGYYVSNTDILQAVKVDFGNGPVEPNVETIGLDLDYAGFTRPVFTYLNVKYALEKPQVLDFAKYVVSFDGAKRLAGDNGFAPLPDAMYEEYQAQLDALK